jgi:hypothetical protein
MPERVSTNAIEYIIGKMDKVDDCVALSYMQEGHQFAVFNFPSGNRTLVYDMSTQLWHERGDFNVSTDTINRHRAMYLCNWQNKIMVGDDNNNNLYIWNLDQKTDNGKLIRRIRVAPHIHSDRKRIFFKSLEIDMERGVGNTGAAYGSDPQVMLEYSNDGGYSYQPIQLWGKIGKIGERLTRVKFNKLGMSRDRVFRVSITEPVKVILISASLILNVEV